MPDVSDPVLVDQPASGRAFTSTRTVSIADAGTDGRMRFDSIARFLGDVANDDTDDAGFTSDGLAWVARRCVIEISSFAQAREQLTMTTWCSGTGKRWAERRTDVSGSSSASMRAAALWVHLDETSGRPTPWGDDFAEIYLEAAQGRTVDSRLRLPKGPPDEAGAEPKAQQDTMGWRFRQSDLDLLGHVNNAAYLTVLEEALGGGTLPAPLRIEIEWQRPAMAGTDLVVTEQIGTQGVTLWVVGDEGVHCTISAQPI